MNAAAAAIVLAPALALGSFLNVVVARVPARRSIVSPPSACGSCGTEILWRDNIPVLSWALLRGRCRSCDVAISALYPAVEIVTALLIAACFATFGLTARAGLAAGFCAVLVVLSAIDVQHGIVPNRSARKMGVPLAPFLALGSVIALFFGPTLLDAYLTLF